MTVFQVVVSPQLYSRLKVLHDCFPGCSFSTTVSQVVVSPLLFPGCSFSTTVSKVVVSPLLYSRLKVSNKSY